MTSPSLPVAVTRPLPGSVTASMVNSSPPTSVQASPGGDSNHVLGLGFAKTETPHSSVFLEIAPG